jgi:transcriptional regulator with XRE-family HTH domain
MRATAAVLDDLPNIVRAERTRRGIGLREAAEQAGVAVGVLWRVENGKGVSYRLAGAVTRWLAAPTPAPGQDHGGET